MKNITIVGLSAFTINAVDFNIFGMEFLLDLTVPTLALTGNYEADGFIGKLFPFKGKGPFEYDFFNHSKSNSTNLCFHQFYSIKLSNVTLKCDGRLKYSHDIWSIPDLSIYLDIDHFSGDLKGLSDPFINEMLNEIGPELLNELWPLMEPSIVVAARQVRFPII